jgi:hypothetical protein
MIPNLLNLALKCKRADDLAAPARTELSREDFSNLGQCTMVVTQEYQTMWTLKRRSKIFKL